MDVGGFKPQECLHCVRLAFCAICRYKQAKIFDGDTFRDQTHDFLGSRHIQIAICIRPPPFVPRYCMICCGVLCMCFKQLYRSRVFRHHFGKILSLAYMGPCLGPHLCRADCSCVSPDWFTLSFNIGTQIPYKQIRVQLTYIKLNMNCTKSIQICETHCSIHGNWFCPTYIHMGCI